jgi:hypothetical protein
MIDPFFSLHLLVVHADGNRVMIVSTCFEAAEVDCRHGPASRIGQGPQEADVQ